MQLETALFPCVRRNHLELRLPNGGCSRGVFDWSEQQSHLSTWFEPRYQQIRVDSLGRVGKVVPEPFALENASRSGCKVQSVAVTLKAGYDAPHQPGVFIFPI
jgi:hypothetical protein